MSRDIRFRVWSEDEKEYLGTWGPTKPDLLVDWEGTEEATQDNNHSLIMKWVSTKGLVFEQYTGVKDDLGVEIWEGDIVQEVWTTPTGPLLIFTPEDQTTTKRLGSVGTVEYSTVHPFGGVGYKVVNRDANGETVVSVGTLEMALWRGEVCTTRWFRVLGNTHEHPHLLTPPS